MEILIQKTIHNCAVVSLYTKTTSDLTIYIPKLYYFKFYQSNPVKLRWVCMFFLVIVSCILLVSFLSPTEAIKCEINQSSVIWLGSFDKGEISFHFILLSRLFRTENSTKWSNLPPEWLIKEDKKGRDWNSSSIQFITIKPMTKTIWQIWGRITMAVQPISKGMKICPVGHLGQL